MYKLSEDTFDRREKNAVSKLIQSNSKLSYDKNVRKLEIKIANYHKRKYCIMVNSGSSANLLGVSSILYDDKFDLNKGDEIIVPALSWSTTYTPLIQLGLKLVFVDVIRDTFNLNPELVEKAISKKTKAIFCVNILGFCCDYKSLKRISKKYNLPLFEDNCESLGAKYNKKSSGTFGIFSSLSSFYSHHICTIEGGFLLTDNFRIYCNSLALRSHGWIREQPTNSHLKSSKFSKFEENFKFYLPGYNLRPTEINAVIGIEQIKKINKFILSRKKNAKLIYEIFSVCKNIQLQKFNKDASFFGFSFLLKGKLLNKRQEVVKFMEKNKIEGRPIVSGNILNNPMLEFASYRKFGTFENVKYIDKNGFMIGNRSRDLKIKEINFLKKLRDFLDK